MRAIAILILAMLAVLPATAQENSRRYIVGFNPRTSAAQRESAVARLGGQAVDSFDALSAVVAEVPDTARMESLSDDTLQGLSISFIEEDYYTNWLVSVEPSFQALPLPSWNQVQGLAKFSRAMAPINPIPAGVDASEVPWGVRRVNAAAAWPVTEGQGVRVAVVDTGIDANHPDLAGQVVGGYNAIDKNAPYYDDNHHGTHVAGTIAAKRDGKGVVGVAPGVQLLAVKVLDKKGSGRLTSIVKGIVWCAHNNVQVANMSLGSPIGSIFMRLAVEYAAKKGVVIMAAAGNSGGSVGYPASYGGAIAVAASDDRDQIAGFSSRGKDVEFIAPGVSVKSTIPGGGYDSFNGTSMATPHMSGLAALAVARGAHGPDAVRAKLGAAAGSIGLSPAEEGRGLVDAALVVK